MAKAIRFHETGGPEVLKLETVEAGEPGPGQARVRHSYIAVNFIDIYFRTGRYPHPLPAGLGSDAVGVVEAVGPGVLARLRQRMAAQLEPHLLLEGTDKVFPLKLTKTLIGGADACQVRVAEAGKGEEATVERRPDGSFVARKLGLLGSLLVNGEKHKEKVLASGDTLVIGKASFKFREGAK